MVTPTTTSIFYCKHIFALLLLLQCKHRHMGLVPCRVLSSVNAVLAVRCCVLMSIFGLLLMHPNFQYNDGYRNTEWEEQLQRNEEETCTFPGTGQVHFLCPFFTYLHRSLSSFVAQLVLLSEKVFPGYDCACFPSCSTMWLHSFTTCRKRKCCLRCANYCCLLLLVWHLGQPVLLYQYRVGLHAPCCRMGHRFQALGQLLHKGLNWLL